MFRFALSVALLLAPATLSAQQVRARVIDDATRLPITGAGVSAVDTALAVRAATQTGDDGFFELEGLSSGRYTLVVEQHGYQTVRQALVVDTRSLTVPAILLRSSTIALDSIEARARRRPEWQGAVSEFILSGARLARLEEVNASPGAVFRTLSPGLRVRGDGRRLCVQSARGVISMREWGGGAGSCDPVMVVLDGQLVRDGGILSSLKVRAYESIEYLPPVEAGLRYGLEASAVGAIVLWTRGFGPHRSEARNPAPPPQSRPNPAVKPPTRSPARNPMTHPDPAVTSPYQPARLDSTPFLSDLSWSVPRFQKRKTCTRSYAVATSSSGPSPA